MFLLFVRYDDCGDEFCWHEHRKKRHNCMEMLGDELLGGEQFSTDDFPDCSGIFGSGLQSRNDEMVSGSVLSRREWYALLPEADDNMYSKRTDREKPWGHDGVPHLARV